LFNNNVIIMKLFETEYIQLVKFEDTTGMIFFSYLTDFSYLPLKIVFRKLLDMVSTGQK
jgi:hypothetical protein